jgi:hypothetical protein
MFCDLSGLMRKYCGSILTSATVGLQGKAELLNTSAHDDDDDDAFAGYAV